MTNIFRAYNVFTSKACRITMNVLCGVVFLVNAVVMFAMSAPNGAQDFGESGINGMIPVQITMPLMVASAMMVLIQTFSDYFIFAGISARNTGTMGVMRTSLSGEAVIKKGMTGDFIANTIRSFTAVPLLGIVVAILFYRENCFFTISAILAIWGGSMATVGGVDLLIRRFTKTMTSMVVFCYLGAAVFGVIASVISLGISAVNSEMISPWIMAACAVVLIGLAVILFMIGKKEAVKGYRSGFEDKVGGKEA